MSSKIVFDEIEAGNWQIVKELIATTNYLTRTDLEEKHGVKCRIMKTRYF